MPVEYRILAINPDKLALAFYEASSMASGLPVIFRHFLSAAMEAEHCRRFNPDLLILDAGLDGAEALAGLLRGSCARELPVILDFSAGARRRSVTLDEPLKSVRRPVTMEIFTGHIRRFLLSCRPRPSRRSGG